MNETARDYAETKRGLKNQIQERGTCVFASFDSKVFTAL